MNSNSKKRSLAMVFSWMFLLLAGGAKAQLNLPLESAKIQLAYKNPAYLSFDIKNTYAYEATPTTIIDSLTGTFKISGNSYWGTQDSVEFMQNSSYCIFVYKPQHLINVNNPMTVYPAVSNFSLLDSLLGKNNYTPSLTTSGANKVISITFTNPDFPYKNYSIFYDSTSNLVNKISYSIREDFDDYNDSYNRSAAGNTSSYLIVTATFTNYSTAVFSNTFFNTGNYFVLSNGTYTPQAPYSAYEVFLGAGNLYQTVNPTY